jgi:cephalosporin-C deacetylase-like acetyl esterase
VNKHDRHEQVMDQLESIAQQIDMLIVAIRKNTQPIVKPNPWDQVFPQPTVYNDANAALQDKIAKLDQEHEKLREFNRRQAPVVVAARALVKARMPNSEHDAFTRALNALDKAVLDFETDKQDGLY